MKKIICLLISLSMLFAIIPCYANATLSAQDIVDGITFDMVTNQSSYAVTKNLDFSSIVSAVEENGATVSFKSSDSEVLLISRNTGKITRKADNDADVTLTVTVSKDGAAASKEIEFIVPAQSVYVFESEGFGRENCLNKGIQSVGKNWAGSAITENVSYGISGKIEKDENGYFYDITKSEYSASSTPFSSFDFSDMPKADVITISFDLTLGSEYVIDTADANKNGIYWDMFLYAKDANGKPLKAQNNSNFINKVRMQVSNSETAKSALLLMTTRTDDAGKTSLSGTKGYVMLGKKTRITYIVDIKNQTCTISQDGTELATLPFLENSTTPAASLDSFKFNIQRQGVSATMRIDDFVVTSPRNALYGENLTVDDAKGKLKLKVTGHNERVAITSDYNENSTLTQVMGINYYNQEHVEYYESYLTDSSGKRTDLLERQVADETPAITLNGALVGGNHGPNSPIVTVENHGKTLADVGTLWRDAAGGEWVIVQVRDENNLGLFSTRVQSNWSFPASVAEKDTNGATSRVLTRIEDGEETEETMTFSSQKSHMLFFLNKDINRVCTAYLPDGTTEVLDLKENRELEADKLQIVESYIITDPRTFAAALIENRPEDGYSEENPPYPVDGEDAFLYKVIFTFLEDGTILQEWDHECLIDVKYVDFYGLMYYMKADLGGGVKRLIPGSTAFEATSSVFSGRDSISEGPVTTFDFSVPQQVYRLNTGLSYNTFDLPGSATRLTKGLGFDTDVPPSRQIDFMYDETDVSDISFASGWLPFYDAAPEVRAEYTDYAFNTRGTAKTYHYLISKNKGKAGDTIKGIAYRKYEDADRYDGKASVYSIPYENEVYYYVDLLEDSAVDVCITGVNSENLTVVENYGDAELTIYNGKVNVSGDQKDYIVFTVPKIGYEISKASCNISTGEVSVLVNSLSDENQDVKLICAGYDEGKMTQIEMKNITVTSGNSVFKLSKDFSSVEKMTVFMLDSDGRLMPLCESFEQDGLGL